MIAIDKTKSLASISSVWKCFNLKRDAFYKYNRRVNQRHVFEHQIIDIVKKRRKSLPREGVRKLMKSLNGDFGEQQLKVGRDTLFNILREHKMLTLRKKYSARTTNSYHRFYKYNNLLKDLEINRSNQVWASHITYIRTLKGFC
jgi:putative transposase